MNKTMGYHCPEILRVRKAVGQLEGIEKVIINKRQFFHITQQVEAAVSALSSLKLEILKRHFRECVEESKQTNNYSKLAEQVIEIFLIKERR